jgi:predicted transposase/invertase (TIGR01784 family)
MNKEMLDFLKYVEHSNDETANTLNSTLVKNIHNKVKKVKNNHEIEVEYMTLLDRDREKREEGRLEGKIEIVKKAILKGFDDEEIQELTDLSIERIADIRKSLI